MFVPLPFLIAAVALTAANLAVDLWRVGRRRSARSILLVDDASEVDLENLRAQFRAQGVAVPPILSTDRYHRLRWLDAG